MYYRTMVTLLLLIAVSTGLYGQPNEQPTDLKGWKLGWYGLLGTAGFSYNSFSKINAGPALQLGGVAQYNFGHRLAMRTGLIYSSAKGEIGQDIMNWSSSFSRYEAQFKHTDLLAPLELLAYKRAKTAGTGMYASLGVGLGVRLTRKAEVEGNPYFFDGVKQPAVSIYNTLGYGYAFELNQGKRFFVQLTFGTNAIGHFILSLDNLFDQRSEGHGNMTWLGLGMGTTGILAK